MQMPLWQIIILAVVQGLTEFLPISSSGHVVILASLLSHLSGDKNVSLDVTQVNIVLHAGTLLSILLYYAGRIRRLFGEDRRTIGLLIVGTIPAAAIGVTLKITKYDRFLSDPLLAGAMLIVTGCILLWGASRKISEGSYVKMGYGSTLLIGISQALAILPGISRSGATICTGLSLGLTRRSAATFSFLLAIPAIAGATLLELVDLVEGAPTTTSWQNLALGGLVAFLVGLFALRWLVAWLERGRLWWFAPWCFFTGLCVLTWQLWPQSS